MGRRLVIYKGSSTVRSQLSSANMSPDAETKVSKKSSHQDKTGLDMPVSKIKSDIHKHSGCPQMAYDAAIVAAAAHQVLISSVVESAMRQRAKGQSSISPEVMIKVLKETEFMAPILGPNPVFVVKPNKRKTGPRKKRTVDEAAATDAEASATTETPVKKEKKPRVKKEKKATEEPKPEPEEEPAVAPSKEPKKKRAKKAKVEEPVESSSEDED